MAVAKGGRKPRDLNENLENSNKQNKWVGIHLIRTNVRLSLLDTCTYDKTTAIPSRPTKLARRILRMNGRESSIV